MSAQSPEDPNALFMTQVMRLVLTHDGPGAARLIQANQPRARESFQILVVGYPTLTEPKQQALAKMYVNTVAQVFAASGDDTLLRQLKSEGLLAEPPPSPTSERSETQ